MACLQRSARCVLLSLWSWSSHLFWGRPGHRLQLGSGRRPSGTASLGEQVWLHVQRVSCDDEISESPSAPTPMPGFWDMCSSNYPIDCYREEDWCKDAVLSYSWCSLKQRYVGMAFNIPIPCHSHLFNSHSLPSHSQLCDSFPFPWDSQVCYSHTYSGTIVYNYCSLLLHHHRYSTEILIIYYHCIKKLLYRVPLQIQTHGSFSVCYKLCKVQKNTTVSSVTQVCVTAKYIWE